MKKTLDPLVHCCHEEDQSWNSHVTQSSEPLTSQARRSLNFESNHPFLLLVEETKPTENAIVEVKEAMI
jgi:hypothetical protein